MEEAYEFVEKIEDKMIKVSNVIRGMDKRMSYNMRLMNTVIPDQKLDINEGETVFNTENGDGLEQDQK